LSIVNGSETAGLSSYAGEEEIDRLCWYHIKTSYTTM